MRRTDCVVACSLSLCPTTRSREANWETVWRKRAPSGTNSSAGAVVLFSWKLKPDSVVAKVVPGHLLLVLSTLEHCCLILINTCAVTDGQKVCTFLGHWLLTSSRQ